MVLHPSAAWSSSEQNSGVLSSGVVNSPTPLFQRSDRKALGEPLLIFPCQFWFQSECHTLLPAGLFPQEEFSMAQPTAPVPPSIVLLKALSPGTVLVQAPFPPSTVLVQAAASL